MHGASKIAEKSVNLWVIWKTDDAADNIPAVDHGDFVPVFAVGVGAYVHSYFIYTDERGGRR